MSELTQFIVTGLAVGMIYALIALGFALIWKSTGVANLALGQLVLICSWFTYSMMQQAHLPIWLAFPAVLVFAIIMGWVIERFALRPLIGQPILSLIAVTLGVGYFISGMVSFVWPQSIGALPRFFPKAAVHLGDAVVSQEYVWAAGVSVLMFGLLTLFYKYHKMGIAMRATADDQMAVQACGIPVTRIFSWSWMFACALAAVGGILISSIGGISNGLVETGLKTFSVVILGGLDSFGGAMVAGPIIGLAKSLGTGYLTPYLWPEFGEVIPYLIIVIVVIVKPFGLFGEKRIERI